MINYTRLIILLSTMVLLSACQSTPANSPDVVFKDEGLRQHHLSLVKATGEFADGTLVLSGGVWPEHKQLHVDCGQVEFQIFDTQGALLKTITADYSPCHLHYQPNTRRVGNFSVTVSGIHPQQLVIAARYRSKD